MADEREAGFKISDRRKFNPDGTPKDLPPEEPNVAELPPSTAQVEPEAPKGDKATASTSGDNILSFPGETAKKKDAAPGPAPDADTQASQSSARESASAAQAYDHASTGRETQLPPASFLGIANMLGVEAAMHLGLIESAPGAGTSIDLDAAKHVIDLIGILQEKTKGNLTREEDALLDNMLADLRMHFVSASRRR